MSDNWGHYFANMRGKPASIVFDDGISETINTIKLQTSLKLKISLQEVRDDGLPTPSENDRLGAFDEQIQQCIETRGGVYLGRVTNNGVRWGMSLVPDKKAELEAALEGLAKAAQYEMNATFEDDPDKLIYWEDLYPGEEDRCVMNDLSVIKTLERNGDRGDIERPVDHWTYFSDEKSAIKFQGWLIENNYERVRIEKIKPHLFSKPRWCVYSGHFGSMLLNDLTHHTLKHLRAAKELGGKYDGWETQVKTDNG